MRSSSDSEGVTVNMLNVNSTSKVAAHQLPITTTVKNLLKESWPYILSRLFAVPTYFATTLIIVKYNPDFLPATPYMTSLQLLTLSSMVGALYATGIAIGRRYGRGQDIDEVGGIFHASSLLSVIYSIPVAAVLIFSKPIFKLFGQSDILASIALKYFYALTPGVPAYMGFSAAQQLLIGIGEPITVLGLTVINAGLLSGLGYWLVNGGLGIPAMGVTGMGLSFTITSYVSLLSALGYFLLRSKVLSTDQYKEFKIFNITPFKKLMKYVLEQVKLGLPIAGQVFAELVALFAVTLYAGLLGKKDLSYMQIADQYLTAAVVSGFAFAQTTGTLVSRQNGQKNYHAGRRYGNTGLVIGALGGIGVALLLTFAYKPLTSVFDSSLLDNPEAVNQLRYLFLINGVGEIFDYARNISAGALRGYYQTLTPMLINLASMWGLEIGLAYLLGFTWGKGLTGIYLGRGLAFASAGLLNTALWLYQSNKKMIEQKKGKENQSEPGKTWWGSMWSKICPTMKRNEPSESNKKSWCVIA